MKLSSLLNLLITLSLLILSGCTHLSQGVIVDSDRHASITKTDSFGDSAERTVYPEQNWSGADSLWFYNISQGSNLMPYRMFLHLEVANGNELFRSDANINRWRYLPQKPSLDNSDGLPVGWVKDSYKGKEYIGFTCAACHTGQINYQGVAIRIDGAPALADMDTMLKELAAALQASLNNPEKFARLAHNVLGHNYPAQTEDFRAQLAQVTMEIANYNQINAPTHTSPNGSTNVAYGYGRVDAFGRIYNRILGHLTPNEPNYNPASAPVSYPFLWDTPQHDFVQWNGSADNALAGPLGRNTGEVLGVFAQFDLTKTTKTPGYLSSVEQRNLARTETHLKDLWSPSWMDLAKQQVLPAINTQLAEQGRAIYYEYQCHSCHEAIDRTSSKRRVTAQMASLKTIGTDPYMAMNALKHAGKSGYFKGEHYKVIDPKSPTFGDSTLVLPALSHAVEGVVLAPDHDKSHLRRWADKCYDLFTAIGDNPIKKTQKHLDFEPVAATPQATFGALAAYKARPLNGIWATAPYLHNGSVANLYELFLPSCSNEQIAAGKHCRANSFTLGAREFDPIHVGFVQKDPAQYSGLFVFNTQLPSNSNKGHEYAAGVTPVMKLDQNGKPMKNAEGNPITYKLNPLNHSQRLALVEYLKTL